MTMIAKNVIHQAMWFMTLLLLPMNISIMTRTTHFVQDMVGTEPTVRINNNSSLNSSMDVDDRTEETSLQPLTAIPSMNDPNTFAGCLQIMDDNHFLIEWLAYHYHVMPLRYLIVAIDPGSKTSPLPIFKRYKDRKLMTISVWNDTMFMPAKINSKPGIFNNNTELMMHRVRQNNFYFKVSFNICTINCDD